MKVLVQMSADSCETVDIGQNVKDPLYLVSVLDDWAEVRVCGATLGPIIHFSTVLLVDRCDVDVLGFGEELQIVVGDDLV